MYLFLSMLTIIYGLVLVAVYAGFLFHICCVIPVEFAITLYKRIRRGA